MLYVGLGCTTMITERRAEENYIHSLMVAGSLLVERPLDSPFAAVDSARVLGDYEAMLVLDRLHHRDVGLEVVVVVVAEAVVVVVVVVAELHVLAEH